MVTNSALPALIHAEHGEHAIAKSESLGAVPNRFDGSGHVPPECNRQLLLRQKAALPDLVIYRIDAGHTHPDEQLTCARTWNGNILDPNDPQVHQTRGSVLLSSGLFLPAFSLAPKCRNGTLVPQRLVIKPRSN